MGHQVEQACGGGATAHGQHHVAQLGDGAVGQPLLEVHLGEGNGCPQDAGEGGNAGNGELHLGEEAIEGFQPGHQKHPRSHHGGGMDQGGDGRGTLHGVRQPHMERKLGGLGHGAHEHQQAEEHRNGMGQDAVGDGGLHSRGHPLEAKLPRGPEQPQDAQQQAKIPHPVDDEGFLRGMGRPVAVIPEAHQEIGAHAHQLPEHVDFQQIGAYHQPQHGAAEQGQVGEKAHIALVMGHVAVGVDHHQEGNATHHHQHHGREGINAVAHLQVERACVGPVKELFMGGRPGYLLPQGGQAQHRGGPHRAGEQQGRRPAQSAHRTTETDESQAHNGGPHKGQDRNQPSKICSRRHRSRIH